MVIPGQKPDNNPTPGRAGTTKDTGCGLENPARFIHNQYQSDFIMMVPRHHQKENQQ